MLIALTLVASLHASEVPTLPTLPPLEATSFAETVSALDEPALRYDYALEDYELGSRLTRNGFRVGAISLGVVVVGAVVVVGGAFVVVDGSPELGIGLVAGGIVAMLGGYVGTYVGAGMVNAGAAKSTRAANDLGAFLVPGSTPGWVLFGVSFVPYIGLPALIGSYIAGGIKQGNAKRALRGMDLGPVFDVRLMPMIGPQRGGLRLVASF